MPSWVSGLSEKTLANDQERRAALTEQTASQIQLLTDRAEVIRVVDEIDNTVDAKDWTACRGYFLDELYVDFTSLAGGSPVAWPLTTSWGYGPLTSTLTSRASKCVRTTE